jgi:protein-L-isoaspartate(D-aspartate) O-methyltransferase
MVSSERLLKDKDHRRFNMVNGQLRPHGIGEARLIQAFESVPREAFVPPAIQSLVYADANLLLTKDSTPKRWLLAPLILGKLLQLGNIQPGDKVLIVGCGSGYSLALVAQLAAHVIGLESDNALASSASHYGIEQGISNSQVVIGALSIGYPKNAPYDVILIEGAVDKIPPILLQQLSCQKGRLVTVVKKENEFGKGVLVTRSEDALNEVSKFEASCPYLPEFEPTRGFQL